jgi:hypothetical protein
MDLVMKIILFLGAAWFFLVGYLVLGMCRQKYMKKAAGRTNIKLETRSAENPSQQRVKPRKKECS